MLKIHSQASYLLYLLLDLIRSNRAAYTFTGYTTFNPIEINERPLNVLTKADKSVQF